MKLNDLKAGMNGKLRDGSNISVIDNGYGVVDMDGYLIIQLSLRYNDDLTNKDDKDRDIMELWYGDKLVFERKEEKTPVDWKPENNESYYFVYNNRGVYKYIWKNDDFDKMTFETYRLFKTKIEGEKHLEWLKAKRSIELEIARLNEGWTPDWNNSWDKKWRVDFDYETEKLTTVYQNTVKTLPNSMYLKGKTLAEKLIETHEKELRIYLEEE